MKKKILFLAGSCVLLLSLLLIGAVSPSAQAADLLSPPSIVDVLGRLQSTTVDVGEEEDKACSAFAAGKLATAASPASGGQAGYTLNAYTCDGTNDYRLVIHPARPVNAGDTYDINYLGVAGNAHTIKASIPVPQEIIDRGTTYQWFDVEVPVANEKQVFFNENTDGSWSGLNTLNTSLPNSDPGRGLMDWHTLVGIALEWSGSASEAVDWMGYLIETYGLRGAAESFTVSDPDECWVFEIPGNSKMWLAQRIPDNAVVFHANKLRLQEIDLDDPVNFRYSKDENGYPSVISNAVAKTITDTSHPLYSSGGKYYEPERDGAFNFEKIYSSSRTQQGSVRREWIALSLLCPSVDWDPEAISYPVYVVPEIKVTPEWVMDVLWKNAYEDTPYSLAAGYSAGPFKTIDRQSGTGTYERPIATHTQTYTTVGVGREWVPDEMGLMWYTNNHSRTGLYVPIYLSTKREDMPASWWDLSGFGTEENPVLYQWKYDPESTWWQFQMLKTFCNLRYMDMLYDVRNGRTVNTSGLSPNVVNYTVKGFATIEAEDRARMATVEAEAMALTGQARVNYLSAYTAERCKNADTAVREMLAHLIRFFRNASGGSAATPGSVYPGGPTWSSLFAAETTANRVANTPQAVQYTDTGANTVDSLGYYYYVTFDPGDGEFVLPADYPNPAAIKTDGTYVKRVGRYNHGVALPPEPLREGYVFLGWFDGEDGAGDEYVCEVVPTATTKGITTYKGETDLTGDLYLYAQWAEEPQGPTYKVEFVWTDARTVLGSQQVKEGGLINQDTVPEFDASGTKRILSWAQSAQLGGGTILTPFDMETPITQDITLVASKTENYIPPVPAGNKIEFLGTDNKTVLATLYIEDGGYIDPAGVPQLDQTGTKTILSWNYEAKIGLGIMIVPFNLETQIYQNYRLTAAKIEDYVPAASVTRPVEEEILPNEEENLLNKEETLPGQKEILPNNAGDIQDGWELFSGDDDADTKACSAFAAGKDATIPSAASGNKTGYTINAYTCDGSSNDLRLTIREPRALVKGESYYKINYIATAGNAHTIFKDIPVPDFVIDGWADEYGGQAPKAQTNKWFKTEVPIANEKQVFFNENTQGSTGALSNSTSTNCFTDWHTLLGITLEWADSAQAAVTIMGYLIENYGLRGSAESFAVSDPNEVWTFEIPGNSTMWVAARIPDDAVSYRANRLCIQDIDFDDPYNFRYSVHSEDGNYTRGKALEYKVGQSTLVTNAMNVNRTGSTPYYDPDLNGPFNFVKVYSSTHTPTSNVDRQWPAMMLLCPSFDWKLYSISFPLWVIPEVEVTPEWVMDTLLKHSNEDTQLDRNNGYQHGPFRSPDRQSGSGSGPYHISTDTQAYTSVGVGRDVPNEMGMTWFSWSSSRASLYVPLYVSTKLSDMPKGWYDMEGFGTEEDPVLYQWKYDENSTFWQFQFLKSLCNVRYSDMINDVRNGFVANTSGITPTAVNYAVKGFATIEAEDRAKVADMDAAALLLSGQERIDYLSAYSGERARNADTAAREMIAHLITRYRNGNPSATGFSDRTIYKPNVYDMVPAWTSNPTWASLYAAEQPANYFKVKMDAAVKELGYYYDVKFDANGGAFDASLAETYSIKDGILAKRVAMFNNGVYLPPQPVRADDEVYSYTFAGWFDAAAGGNHYLELAPISGDLILYAQWTAEPKGPTHKIEFVWTDGNTVMGTLVVADGGYLNAADVPNISPDKTKIVVSWLRAESGNPFNLESAIYQDYRLMPWQMNDYDPEPEVGITYQVEFLWTDGTTVLGTLYVKDGGYLDSAEVPLFSPDETKIVKSWLRAESGNPFDLESAIHQNYRLMPWVVEDYVPEPEPERLPVRVHYQGKWQDGVNDMTVETGGRLALHAVYFTGDENSPTGKISTDTAVIAAGKAIAFQWYQSATNDYKGTAIPHAMGNDYIPDTGATSTNQSSYYYAELIYTPDTATPEVTEKYYSDIVKVTVEPNSFPTALMTPAEASGWTVTTSSAEVYELCQALAANSGGRIRLSSLGQTAGRKTPTNPSASQDIPLLIIGQPAPASPDAIPADKAVALINAGIHSGEVEGKESMLIFAREVALGQHDDLLEDLVILLVPNFNADGNDYLYNQRNSTQYTPKLVGSRFTGAEVNPYISEASYNPTSESHNWYNINRDMTKLDAKESTAIVKLMNEWDPVIFVDLHATNGSLMRHAVTFNWGLHPNTDPAIMEYNMGEFAQKAVGEDSYLYNVQGKTTQPYGNFSGGSLVAGTTRWNSFEDYPRYTTNYAGLRNRLALLTEVYSHDPYTVRVDTQYACAYGILQAVAEDKDKIKTLIAAADQHAVDRAVNGLDPEKDFVALNSTMEYLYDITVETYQAAPTGSGPLNYVLRDDLRTVLNASTNDRVGTVYAGEAEYTIPYYGNWTPTVKMPMGAYYLLDADCAEAVTLLRAHGIVVSQLEQPVAVDAGGFQWYKATRRAQSGTGSVYEGHLRNNFVGAWQTADKQQVFPAGTYVVSSAQPFGDLAALLLEPAAVDGAVTWNFFDNHLNADASGMVRAGYPSETSDVGVIALPIFKVAKFDALGEAIFTVTFVDWDGEVLDEQQVEYGSAATAPGDPVREGYTFVGWVADFSAITSNLTVTARYEINVYTVTFADWDGAVLDEQQVEYGSAATAPADPLRADWVFAGWDVGFSYITGDLTVVALYEPTIIRVTPDAFVTKLSGNKNNLTITVTELWSDGRKVPITQTFSINNNAAGTYTVNGYRVYVDTKGNTQIRECYIVNS